MGALVEVRMVKFDELDALLDDGEKTLLVDCRLSEVSQKETRELYGFLCC